MNASLQRQELSGIAVIGMAGRFPGARNLDEFWRNLCDGVESITFFTDEELEAAGIDEAACSDPCYVRARGVLQEAEVFDAAFFGFSPREAELLDPQQRLFLQCAWHALENAGYDPVRCTSVVGVYAGLSSSSYLSNNLHSSLDSDATVATAMLGNDRDFFATRVAYKLNLRGPCLTLQTACSTSLVAVHTACQALLTCECDMALAGGATIKVPQQSGYYYEEGGIYSPDGHCRAFDAAARGTVGGSGVGVVVLKRLQDAFADRDRIDAVILGSAVNNDGASKVGYTAPSVEGQAEVIAAAQALAGIDAADIGYVEAHGTGTPLGDPIEITALTKAFRVSTNLNGSCAIGSVKTNVGHLDAAAGIAGFIKTVLAIRHAKIPPSLHFQQANPQIDFGSSPFFVNTALADWENPGKPRLAGVSSFGIGGTNAHVILGEAPTQPKADPSRRPHLLTLSARSPSALNEATRQLSEWLNSHSDENLADVAYTLQVGRHSFDCRRSAVCSDAKEAAATLAACDPSRVFTAQGVTGRPPVAFMFPGQGSQFPAMGQELYADEPIFRRELDACCDLLASHLNLDLRELLYSSTQDKGESERRLRRTAIAQPALFAIEYAMASLWMGWGVKPQAMIGHSIGEYVAACIAGVMSLPDALAVVAARGRLMEAMAPGAMIAVSLSLADVAPILTGGLSVAALNAPRQTVVSGPEKQIAEFEHGLATTGSAGVRLHTSHAFHSAMMDPVLGPFREQLERIALQPPQVPFLSNLTGTWITNEQATSTDYWVRHVRETVRFSEGVAELLREPSRVMLEVGPGLSLVNLARRHCEPNRTMLATVSASSDGSGELHGLLNTVGSMWLAGIDVDWAAVNTGQARRRLALPVYPFERERFWVDPTGDTERDIGGRKPLDRWLYTPVWRQSPMVQAPAPDPSGSWLFFVGADSLGLELADRLRERGQVVVCVSAGSCFSAGDLSFTIDPRCSEHYVALLQELRRRGELPARIVHLWCIDPQPADALDRILDLGFNSLLFLAQALAVAPETGAVDLSVVTRDICEVTGREALEPRNALVLGPCKVIPQEISRVSCRTIDISGIEGLLLADTVFAALVARTDSPTIALRNGFRWVQEFTPLHVQTPTAIPLRPNGVYLITGGTGGIGLEIAADLAGRVKPRLALVARHTLSAQNPTHAERLQKVSALKELGSEVLLVQADCANREELAAAIGQVHERFGRVDGVIHAAGIPGGSLLELTTAASARETMAAKVEGTLLLEELLSQDKPDFLVLFSSLSALLGGTGQAAYSSANSFLDAFAQSRRRDGSHVISIAWDAWRETGMAVSSMSGAMQGVHYMDLQDKISSTEGVETFRRALSLRIPRVVASVSDLHQLIAHQPTKEDIAFRRKPSPQAHPRPELNATYEAPRNETERSLVAVWQELLGIFPVGIHDDFFTLGGDSLLASQAVSRIRRILRTDLPLQTFFDGATVAKAALAIIHRRARHAGAQDLESALAEIEGLSESEADQELTNKAVLPKEEASHG